MKSRLGGPAAFAVAAAGFVASAALSYWNVRLGYYAVVGWSVLTVMVMPMVGWAFTIFATPFQSLFALGSHDFGLIRATLLLALMARMFSLAVKRRTYGPPVLWLLFAFTVLVSLHDVFGKSSAGQLARDTLFFLALGALYVVSREFGTHASGIALGQIAVISSALVSAAVSFVFLYLPLPELIAVHPSLDNLRLSGVQDNPNALAKFLVLALVCLACRAAFDPRSRRWAVPLTFLAAVFLAATGTKSALIASVASLFILLPLLNRRNVKVKLIWAPAIVVTLGYATWLLGIAQWIEPFAARRWMTHQESNLCFYLQPVVSDAHSCDLQVAPYDSAGTARVWRFVNVLLRDLRLRDSHVMTIVDGKTEYTARAFTPLGVGQRDRTWEGGLLVIRQHWVWGIGGPDQWAQHMRQLTGYPFSSPHDGFLEVIGGYGVMGALLYILVVGLFVRNYLSLRTSVREPWQRMANEWLFLSGAAVFVVEITDVLTVFGITIHAIWFWVIVGLQAGLQDAVMAPVKEAGHAR